MKPEGPTPGLAAGILAMLLMVSAATALSAADREIQSGGNVGQPIVFLGDSLTYGAGAAPRSYSYPSMTSTVLAGRRYVNLGVSGQTSTQIKERFGRLSEYFDNPVVIWAGRNNYGVPAQVIGDVTSIVSMLKTDKYLVLSVLPGDYPAEQPGRSGYLAIQNLNATLAARFGDHFVAVGGNIGPLDRSDEIHLNNKGYIKIAHDVGIAILDARW